MNINENKDIESKYQEMYDYMIKNDHKVLLTDLGDHYTTMCEFNGIDLDNKEDDENKHLAQLAFIDTVNHCAERYGLRIPDALRVTFFSLKTMEYI